jgi:hypothetical protein
MMRDYRILRGTVSRRDGPLIWNEETERHVRELRSYGPGDIVLMTETEAENFGLDCLEPVNGDTGPVEAGSGATDIKRLN